jgi:hypothetical protein
MPLSAWDVPPDQLRKTWRNGLLATGYYVVLAWKNWPTNEKLRVIARFTLADSRLFEADKDVTIRLTPAAKRKPSTVPSLEAVPVEPETPLPLPQKSPVPIGETVTPGGQVNPAALWQSPRPSRAVELLPPTSAAR